MALWHVINRRKLKFYGTTCNLYGEAGEVAGVVLLIFDLLTPCVGYQSNAKCLN